MFVGAVIGALLLGFLAGVLTFKVKNRWCTACGASLTCLDCRQRAAYPVGRP
jgi:hypothetical protein